MADPQAQVLMRLACSLDSDQRAHAPTFLHGRVSAVTYYTDLYKLGMSAQRGNGGRVP